MNIVVYFTGINNFQNSFNSNLKMYDFTVYIL